MSPAVSIVIPAYNAGRYLRECIDSILAQTFSDFEILVIDDASTDNTSDVLASYSDLRVRSVHHCSNSGPGAARNTGLRQARGRWVAFSDADDAWMPTRLEKLVGLAKEHPGAFVADLLIECVVGPQGQLVPFRPMASSLHMTKPFAVDAETFLRTELPFKPMVPLATIRQHEIWFAEDIPYAEDFLYWMQLYRHGLTAWVVPEYLYQYRLSPGSLSTNPRRLEWELSVIRTLLEQPGFSGEIIALLESRAQRVVRMIPYIEFREALLRRDWSSAARAVWRHPGVLLQTVCRIPPALCSRIMARRFTLSLR